MAARAVPFLATSPRAVVAISMLLALLSGVALAVNMFVGLSILGALLYVPLALVDLPLAIALWIPIVFLGELSLRLPLGAAAGSLIVLAWLGKLRAREMAARPFVGENRRVLMLLGVFLVWLTLTAVWAQDLDRFGTAIVPWFTSGLLFLVVTTTIATARDVRLVMGAFVVGALISVILGLVESDPGSVTSSAEAGRLYGGSGDPNYSAGGYLAAIILAAGLLGGTRRTELRAVLVAAMVALAGGLAATQSRGAVVGAAAAALAALVIYSGRRAQVLAVVATVLSVAALIFSFSPTGWERITTVKEDEPRSELWLVAWRMAQDHPLTGVGLANFEVEASDYVQEPGELRYVDLIADRPHAAHSSVLQLLADTGVLGLLLYAALVVACLRAAVVAANRFDAQRQTALAGLARATAVAIVAMIAVSLFLSNVSDRRTWLLLALGPTLLSIATGARWRRPRAPAY